MGSYGDPGGPRERGTSVSTPSLLLTQLAAVFLHRYLVVDATTRGLGLSSSLSRPRSLALSSFCLPLALLVAKPPVRSPSAAPARETRCKFSRRQSIFCSRNSLLSTATRVAFFFKCRRRGAEVLITRTRTQYRLSPTSVFFACLPPKPSSPIDCKAWPEEHAPSATRLS